MKIGFTGSREGMTLTQTVDLIELLEELQPDELHHGDCVGSDAKADEIAKALGIRRVAHPPSNDIYRAWCECEEIREPRSYFRRNRDIVDETEVLVATPRSSSGGGTWYTINYARKRGKQVRIL